MRFPTMVQDLFASSSNVSIISAYKDKFFILKNMGKVTGSKQLFNKE